MRALSLGRTPFVCAAPRRVAAGGLLKCLITLFLTAQASSAHSQQALSDRPDEGGAPTRVEVAVYVIDVERIDNSRQQFTGDVVFELSWMDRRLTSSPGRLSLQDIWHPQAYLFNQRGLEAQLPEVVEIGADGRVSYLQRFYGDLSAPLDLRDFPFDTQRSR